VLLVIEFLASESVPGVIVAKEFLIVSHSLVYLFIIYLFIYLFLFIHLFI
jgi:hypothetical protein